MTDEIKKRSIKLRLTVFAAKVTVLGIGLSLLGEGTNIATAYAKARYSDARLWIDAQTAPREIEKIVQVDPNDAPIQELISDLAQRREIPVPLARAIAEVESAGGKYVYRFEPALYAQMSDMKVSDSERRALASSHGVMHVLGRNAKLCGISWPQLYVPRLGIDCGLKILSDCLTRNKGNFDRALICYNGGSEYPNRVKLALADEILREGL